MIKFPKDLPEIEYFLGCDPSSTNSAYAILKADGTLHDCFIVSHKNNILSQARKHEEATIQTPKPFVACLEGQAVRPKRRGQKSINPKDIITLARVSGVSGTFIASHSNCDQLYIPLPEEWKGSSSKLGHQSNTIKKMGWEPEFRGEGANKKVAMKGNPLNMGLSAQFEAIDAIGLALWIRHEYQYEIKKQATLRRLGR